MNESETLGILWPLGARRDPSGELWLGKCAVSRLAAEHGTPLTIYCEDTLRGRARAYTTALRRFYPASGEIAYASKAYLSLALAQLIAEEGLSLDVVSGGELYVGLRGGVPPSRVHFHGNNKSAGELEQALDAGIGRIVVDNFLELDTLQRLAQARGLTGVPVWLRLATGVVARTHGHLQTGHDDTKFGFSIATGDADRAITAVLRLSALSLLGLHAHIGSQITDLEPLADNARRLVEFAALLRDRHGLVLRELSPGGGWGVPMTETDAPAPVEPYVEAVSQAVAQACRATGLELPHLVLEPGRSIVAPAGVAVYRAGARKEIPGVRTYVSVDGGMADNIRPILYGARYAALAIAQRNDNAEPVDETVTIAGKFCESGDVIVRDVELPRLEPGDLIAIPMAGAYTLSMASNYNLATRPAVLLVKDGQARLIQRRETYDDLVARDLPLHGAEKGKSAPATLEVRIGATHPAVRPFRKYQASGNDYVVLDPHDWTDPPSPGLEGAIRDRHRGKGVNCMSDFEHELYEQPDVVTRLIAEESDHAVQLAAGMRRRGVQYVMVAGRGTSDNAGVYGKYLFAAMNGIPVALATPSLFSIYHTPPRFGDALVLGISQSGQSPDIVSVLAEARRQGTLTAAFTNDPDSPLAQQADHVLALHAGPELSVAATKTYTSQLAAVALLNTALKGDPALLSALLAAPAAMRAALELAPQVTRIAERYRFTDRLVVLGRGYNLATAQEIALKLKETNYIAAEPYSPADFIHGPTAMVDENCPVLVVAPSGALLAELQEAISLVAGRGGEILVLSDDQATLDGGRLGLRLPGGVPEWLSPLVAVLPGQMLALHMVLERGRDPDRPRGLSKVTLTR